MSPLHWTFRLMRYAAGQAEPEEALSVYRAVQASEELRDQLFAIHQLGQDFDSAWEKHVPGSESQPAGARINIRGAIDVVRKVAIAGLAELTGAAGLKLAGQGTAGAAGHAEVRDDEAELRAEIERGADLDDCLSRMETLAERAEGLHQEIVWDVDWDGNRVGEIRMFPEESRGMIRVDTEGQWAAVVYAGGRRDWLDLEEVDGLEGAIAAFDLPDGPFEVSLLRV